MNKYLYLLGTMGSFVTFMVGWNHLQDNGFATFNIGFMALTPLTGFILTIIWLKSQPEEQEEL